MPDKPPATIVTFYSYKGGTGRSMALANVAWILASQGKRVLTLDWDLEAPGLHRYFYPFLVDKDLTASEGLIDFVLRFATAASTPEIAPVHQAPERPRDPDQRAPTPSATIYLADTSPDLASARQTVKAVLEESGYTLLSDDRRTADGGGGWESDVRRHLRQSTLSLHLVSQPRLAGPTAADAASPEDRVHRQLELAAERDGEPGFSRVIWLPPGADIQPRQLLPEDDSGQAAPNATVLFQVPLDEVFNAVRDRMKREQADQDWYQPYTNILRYASSLDWKFKDNGTVDFIPAGRQGPSYSTRVNSFNWQAFFDRLGGGTLLEIAKERMRLEYDYVLIDSRTGVSDTSGICTLQMPDIVVVCFTLNNQSIDGAAAIAESIDAQRNKAPGQRGIRILPVPCRVEKFEKDKLELARDAAHQRFDAVLSLSDEDKRRYWGQVEFFYEPFYAYEEILATFGDKPLQASSLLASAERLTGYLTNQTVTQLEPMSESDRQIVLAKYARQRRAVETVATSRPGRGFWFYLSYSRRDDVARIEQFFSDLSSEVRTLLGLPTSDDVGFIDRGAPLGEEMEQTAWRALEGSRVLVVLVSPAYLSDPVCGREFEFFLERARRSRAGLAQPLTNIVPVMWVEPRNRLPSVVSQMPIVSPHGGLRRLAGGSRRRDEYQEVLEQVASAVIDRGEALPPHQVDMPPLMSLPSAFAIPEAPFSRELNVDDAAPQGPGAVRFVYLAATVEEMASTDRDLRSYGPRASEWRPFYPPIDESASNTTRAVASSEGRLYHELAADADLIRHISEAERVNSPVVLIVDPWSVLLPKYLGVLQTLDRYSFLNCAVITVWNTEDPQTVGARGELQSRLRAALLMHSNVVVDPLWSEARSQDEFRDALITSFFKVRDRILTRGEVMRPIETLPAKPKIVW